MALAVRVLASEDHLGDLVAVWGEPLDASAADLAGMVSAVVEGDRVVAVAVVRQQPSGPRVDRLYVDPDIQPDAVLGAIGGAFPGRRVTLLAQDPPATLAGHARAAGFEPVYDHVRVQRSLHDARPPARRPLTLRRYEDVARRTLLAVLQDLWPAGQGPNGLTPEQELADLLDLARGGTGFPDRSLWRVAYLDGRPAGVALGQRHEDDPQTAVLLFLGLVEDVRGRGLGHVLHAEALWAMRLAGVERYEDGTARDNTPMRRIFERAGCEALGTSALYVRPGEPALPPPPEPSAPRGLRAAPIHP